MSFDGSPLRIDAAAYSPFGETRLVVELAGRWLRAPTAADAFEPAQLLVESDGRTHSFPEIASSAGAGAVGEDVYVASFVVPAEYEARLGRSQLMLAGGRTVAVPPAMWTMVSAQPELDPVSEDDPVPDTDAPSPVVPELRVLDSPGPVPDAPDAPDLAASAAQAALRSELRDRVATETRLRRTVSELRAQLTSRVSHQERLDVTQGQLRDAVLELRDRLEAELTGTAELHAAHAVLQSSHRELQATNAELSEQLAQLRQTLKSAEAVRDRVSVELDGALGRLASTEAELAAASVGRDSAAGEVAELRSELDHIGAEYAISREPVVDDEIDDAEALLAEAQALTARLETIPIRSQAEADGQSH